MSLPDFETTASPVLEASPPVSARSDVIDVLKGLGIFFVVTNHCFARTSRKFGSGEVTEDFWLYFVNRFIHFAVPMFLFISCALLTRTLAKRWDITRYTKARWRKNVVPYLIASLGYTWLTWGTWHINSEFLSKLFWNSLTGKGYFHLYFTVVLIQTAAAVPLLFLLFRNRKLPWTTALFAGIVAQLVFFTLQREVFRVERPGSLIVWYCVPILLGLAVGLDKGITTRLRPHRWTLLGTSLLLGLLYSWISALPLRGVAISSDAINGAYSLFTGLLAVSVWIIAEEYPQGSLRRFMSDLGRHSLPLFLIHPLLMHLLGGPRITNWMQSVPAAGVIYWLLILVGSFAVAKLFLRMQFGRALVGEELSKSKSA